MGLGSRGGGRCRLRAQQWEVGVEHCWGDALVGGDWLDDDDDDDDDGERKEAHLVGDGGQNLEEHDQKVQRRKASLLWWCHWWGRSWGWGWWKEGRQVEWGNWRMQEGQMKWRGYGRQSVAGSVGLDNKNSMYCVSILSSHNKY